MISMTAFVDEIEKLAAHTTQKTRTGSTPIRVTKLLEKETYDRRTTKTAETEKQALIPQAIIGAATEDPGHRWGGAGLGVLGAIPGGMAGALPGVALNNPALAMAGSTAGSLVGAHLLPKHFRDRRREEAAKTAAAPPPGILKSKLTAPLVTGALTIGAWEAARRANQDRKLGRQVRLQQGSY
jgi:hypothetical protein